MAKDSMTFKLFGRDVTLSKTFKTAGRNADKFGKGAGKSIGGIAAAGAGLAGVGIAAAAFAGKSIGAFQQVGGESLKLQRYMGGTIEDASRLGHVAAMTGIDSESMAKSMGVLSKNLAGNAKVAQGLGINYRDANGQMKPMADILPQLADKFAKMEAGPEKTALALKLFGKQGMNMLPMLNKGSEGIKALTAESDALGTTLNDKDAQAVKDATLNKRKMSESIKGLQIAIGKNLLPIVQRFVTWMTTKVVPAIKGVVGFLEDNKTIVVGLASVIVPLVGGMFAFVKVMQATAAVTGAVSVLKGLFTAGTVAQTAATTAGTAATTAATTSLWGMAAALLANPITWIVVGIVALVAALVLAYKRSETFRNIVQGALRAVGAAFTWLKDKALAAFQWIKTKGWDFLVTVIKNSPLGLQVRAAFAAFKWLKENIGKAVDWISSKWDGVIAFFKGIPDRIKASLRDLKVMMLAPFKAAFNAIADAWNNTIGGSGFTVPSWVKFVNPAAGLIAGKSFTIPEIPRLAVGGYLNSDGLIFGHRGERVMPADVTTGPRGYMRGAESGGIHIHMAGATIVGSDDAAGRQLVEMLRRQASKGNRLAMA